MSVFKNLQRNGAWSYDFWLGGVRHRGYCLDEAGRPVTSRTAAKAAEEAVRVSARSGQLADRRQGRAGDYALAQAQAAIVQRAIDRKRKRAHVDNLVLWGDHALEHFGAETPFRTLSQKDLDGYAAKLLGETVRKWLGGNRRPTAAERKDPAMWRDTGRPLSKRQVNNYLKHLRRLLEIAGKVRDPVTRQPVLSQAPELTIELERVPRRKPRPMTDRELAQRLAELTPWARDAAELSRLFGLRAGEALKACRRHVDREARALFFRGEETKSGHDEHAYGGAAGWKLLQRLDRQAERRGVQHLVTWPGPIHVRAVLAGRRPDGLEWRPLKTLSGSWRKSAGRAGVTDPHRFHDVRARYITAVAQADKAATKQAARHQDPATTDLYISVADDEVRQAVAKAVARRPKMAAAPKRVRSK